MGYNLRDLVEVACPGQSEEFAIWAWGKDYKDIILNDLVEVWNELHGEQLFLEGDGLPSRDIPKMVQLWKGDVNPM